MISNAVSALHAFSLFTDISYYSHAVVDLGGGGWGGGIKGTFRYIYAVNLMLLPRFLSDTDL